MSFFPQATRIWTVINVVKHPYTYCTIVRITNIKKIHLQFKNLNIKYRYIICNIKCNCKLVALVVVKLGQPQYQHLPDQDPVQVLIFIPKSCPLLLR